MSLVGVNGRFLRVNDAFCEMMGRTAEGLLARTIADITHPDDVEPNLAQMHRLLDGEVDRLKFEKRLIHADGRTVWCLLNATLVRDDQEQPQYIISQVQDITERKQAEAQVRGKNRVLGAINAVFEKALSCDSEQELAARCLEVAEELTGSKFGFFGELNPAGLFDTLAISDPGWEACEMTQEEAGESIVDMPPTGVDRTTLRDGEPRIVNDLAGHPDSVPLPKGHPEITCFLGVPFVDGGKTIGMIALANKAGGYDRADQEAVEALSVAVVEALMRQRAETARRESEDLYRTLVELSPDAIVLCDLDYKIVKASPQGARLLGLSSPEELVGRSPLDLMDPQDR